VPDGADAPAPKLVVELAGGVGGAKLAHGLQAHLGDGLSVIVNSFKQVACGSGESNSIWN